MTQIASLLAVATVFIGLWTRNIYILLLGQLADAIKDDLWIANDRIFHRGNIGVVHQTAYVVMKEPNGFLNWRGHGKLLGNLFTLSNANYRLIEEVKDYPKHEPGYWNRNGWKTALDYPFDISADV